MKAFLLVFVLLVSCLKSVDLNGIWKLKLLTQGKEIPFFVEINNKDFTIHNSIEKIELQMNSKSFPIEIPIKAYDALIKLEKIDNNIKGQWIRLNKKEDYKIPLIGEKTNKIDSKPLPLDFPKKWKISFFKEDGITKDAILLFNKNNASILTSTGDYRYLRPVLKKDQLNLYGFDGIFSFNFSGKLLGNTYEGTMYSGKSWNQKFKAVVDESFELPNAYNVTKVSNSFLNACLDSLSGKKICLNKGNRPKVIQLFGSWCPNCIDETKFIQSYITKNNPKVDFYIIAFERSPNKAIATKLLRKTKALYNIDYPILIGSYTADKKVSDVLKGIGNFASFPTSIFVDKKGKIRKVHSGFSGPATGKYYEKFIFEFDSLLKKLLSE